MPWDKLDWAAIGAGALYLTLLLFQSVRGFVAGRREEQPPAISMAGAVVDAKRMDNLTDQVGLNTSALASAAAAIKHNTECLHAVKTAFERTMKHTDDAAEHMEKLAREVRDLRDETKSLRDEMLRRGRG